MNRFNHKMTKFANDMEIELQLKWTWNSLDNQQVQSREIKTAKVSLLPSP
jgi:hypothetical protein